MNLDEFRGYFDRLVRAFNVTRPGEKADVYFDELRGMKVSLFAEVCRRIIRDDERFPPIAKILKIADSMNSGEASVPVRAECVSCDGFGWVIFEGHAFRGRCAHGRQLSQGIAFAPATEIDRMNWKNQIAREHVKIYGPGVDNE